MNWRIINSDALKGLRTLDSESVHCCVTSPPYWMLRDYGVDGQIGLEEDFGDYIDRLVQVFKEVHRVLRKDGTLWVNMGDKYLGGGSSGGNRSFNHDAAAKVRDATGKTYTSVAGLPAKNMMGAPWRLAFALQDAGWILRSDIVWYKPNPMPESVNDRPTKAHEYLFLFAKARRYYYDQDAIAIPVTGNAHDRGNSQSKRIRDMERAFERRRQEGVRNGVKSKQNASFSVSVRRVIDGKRNALSVWDIYPQGRSDAHTAAFPDELARRCIIAGCPDGGTVLDPFVGRGTTPIVALRTGRSAIGIELNPEYAALARRNIVDDAPLLNATTEYRRRCTTTECHY